MENGWGPWGQLPPLYKCKKREWQNRGGVLIVIQDNRDCIDIIYIRREENEIIHSQNSASKSKALFPSSNPPLLSQLPPLFQPAPTSSLPIAPPVENLYWIWRISKLFELHVVYNLIHHFVEMMSCLQITVHQHCCNFTSICHLRSASSLQCAAPALKIVQPHKTSTTFNTNSSSYLGAKLPKIAKKLSTGASGVQISTPICLFGGKGKSDNADEGSAWKALEKAMGNFGKEQSVENVLHQQMQKQEYFDDGGGSGRSGPGGGSGDNGESEDESLSGILDEFLQVILATIGFVFLYMLIIEGEEITTFAKDIIRFLFTGRKSIRLRRLIDDWVRNFRSLSAPKEEDPYWLERAILATPTWYDSPTKYKRMFRRYMSSRSD